MQRAKNQEEDKKLMEVFMEDLGKLFTRYIDKYDVSLHDLILSADLVVSTMKQLEEERKHGRKSN